MGGGREKGPFAGWDTSPAPRCPLFTQPQVPATVVLDKSWLVPKLTRQGGPSPFLSLKGVQAAPKPLLAQSRGDPHHPDSGPSLATPRERSWDPGWQHPNALKLCLWGQDGDPAMPRLIPMPAARPCSLLVPATTAPGLLCPPAWGRQFLSLPETQAFYSNLAAFLFFPGFKQASSVFLWGRANSRSGTKRALTHKETAAAQ